MDDSVTVETVSDESVQHPAFLKNETPSFLTSNIQTSKYKFENCFIYKSENNKNCVY